MVDSLSAGHPWQIIGYKTVLHVAAGKLPCLPCMSCPGRAVADGMGTNIEPSASVCRDLYHRAQTLLGCWTEFIINTENVCPATETDQYTNSGVLFQSGTDT